MSNVVYPGFQQPMCQPTFPTQLPQMQRQPMQMMQQPIIQPQPMAQGVLTMVTSKEQAMVAQIPFDGLPYFFYNTAADELYSKRFDPATGQSPLVPYKREQPVQETEWAPMALVQQIAQQMQAMQEQLISLQPRAKRAAPNKEDDAT